MDSLELLTRFGHVEPADQHVVDAAAQALLDTADRRPGSGHRRSQPTSRPPRRVLVGAVSVAAAAAFTVAGLSLSLGGGGHRPATKLAVGTDHHPSTHTPAGVGYVPAGTVPTLPPAPVHHAGAQTGAAILTHLASAVRDAPAPAGDATLVIRSQVIHGGAPILGADLYTDSGKYFYAPSESGLPAQITADNNQGDGVFAREIAAAEQAASANSLTSAIHAMEDAPDPTASAPSSALADNWLWENSLDAFVAGAGNPTVLAGAMRLVSTLPEVHVVETTAQGQPAVQVTARFSITSKCTTAACAKKEALSEQSGDGNYQEQLTLAAGTGTPISFVGGEVGQAPSAQITYQVSRVSVAEVVQGHFVADPAKS